MGSDSIGKIGLLPSATDLQLLRSQKLSSSLNSSGVARSDEERGKQNAAKTEEAAKSFEGMLLQQMFQAMWKNVPQEGLMGGGREGELYQDMFIEGLANNVSSGQGIGIKEVMLKELKKQK